MAIDKLSYVIIYQARRKFYAWLKKSTSLLTKYVYLNHGLRKFRVTRRNQAYEIIDDMTCEMTVLKDQFSERNLI